MIDDETELCKSVKQYIEVNNVHDGHELHITVDICQNFDMALDILEKSRFDLVILDVRLGVDDSQGSADHAGVKTLKAIQETRFVPIIFYTALPNSVGAMASPVITVIEKTKIVDLSKKVNSILMGPIPRITRILAEQFDTVLRNYMWKFATEHWTEFDTPNTSLAELAYLLTRRLAATYAEVTFDALVRKSGVDINFKTSDDKSHPARYYIIPPLNEKISAGDIFLGKIDDVTSHWVLLTPSCDIVQKKAEWVLLSHCLLLSEQPEYAIYTSDNSHSDNNLRALIKNNRQKAQKERFYFLPGAFTIPDMVVDFQQLKAISVNDLNTLTKCASIDSPFCESLLHRFNRYLNRLGTPDIDDDFVIHRLKANA